MTVEELLSRDDIPADVRDALRQYLSDLGRIPEAVTECTYTIRVEGGKAVETYYAETWERITGYRSDEYSGDPSLWYRTISAADQALVDEQQRRALAGEDAPPIEHRIIRKDGTTRWVKSTITPHRGDDGVLLSYDGIVTDVTERKQAQEALRERTSRIGPETARSTRSTSPSNPFSTQRGKWRS